MTINIFLGSSNKLLNGGGRSLLQIRLCYYSLCYWELTGRNIKKQPSIIFIAALWRLELKRGKGF
jgi:hypothetical protein